MAHKNALLDDLLKAVVREWGYIAVAAALDKLGRRAPDRMTPAPKKKLKPTALEQVNGSKLSTDKQNALREIATLFDEKHFLQSVADAREFVMMMGEHPRQMKDRSEAFREILRVVEAFSVERINHLAAQARHAGPSRLGPLSDAISASALGRRREAEEKVEAPELPPTTKVEGGS